MHWQRLCVVILHKNLIQGKSVHFHSPPLTQRSFLPYYFSVNRRQAAILIVLLQCIDHKYGRNEIELFLGDTK